MDMELVQDLLSADVEVELARTIEAGVLAGAALEGAFPAGDASVAELHRLVAEGERAWERMFLANLRMVWAIAHPIAQRTATNADELFQEGCIGLAEGMRRWDHRRGTKFSVVGWKWVRHHVQRAVVAQQQTRQSRGDLRMAAEALAAQERMTRVGTEASLPGVARTLGRDPRAVLRVVEPGHVPLAEVVDYLACPRALEGFEAAEVSAPAWMYRLREDERELLLYRYGFRGEPRSYDWCAAHFGTSASSIRRLERRALVAARQVARWAVADEAA